jgi:photosystem II stability/assembly factor-like uncharacterized protein
MSQKTRRILLTLIAIFFVIISNQQTAANQSSSYIAYIPLITHTQSAWIGPSGGYIVSLAIDPTYPQVVYAATWGSGVYKSLDGGINWKSISYGLENLHINSIAIDPTATSTLYAGTYKSQVYKSTNGGTTWTWSGSGMQDQAVVYSLVVDPINPANVYAATRGISNNGNPPWSGIVYQSTDAGSTWKAVLENVGGEDIQDWVYSIAVQPDQNNNIYVATHEYGPFRSNDYAATWFPIHDGIIDDSGRAIATSPETPNGMAIYYGVWHFDTVYKTLNGGNEWLPANRGITFNKVYNLAIDPTNIERVYLATFTDGILKTTDWGENWQQSGLQEDFIYSVAIDPITPTQVYAGTAGDGLYKSSDLGASWQHADSGINNSMVTKVIVDGFDADRIFTSVYGGGVYRSNDGGASWSEMNSGLEDKFVHTIVENPSLSGGLFALTDTGGLYTNNPNSGMGWVKIAEGLPANLSSESDYPPEHPFATREIIENTPMTEVDNTSITQTNENLLCMVFATSDPLVAYLGTGGSGVYKSVNGGTTWHSTGLSGETIQSIAVDPTSPELVYAASNTTGGLKISQNGGDTWTSAYQAGIIYSLATSEAMPGVLLIGTSDGLYRYENGEFITLGLSTMEVSAIAIEPSLPDRILVGTNSGAYNTRDGGQTWQTVDWDLNHLSIRSIDLDPNNPYRVYFSTQTNGILYKNIGD